MSLPRSNRVWPAQNAELTGPVCDLCTHVLTEREPYYHSAAMVSVNEGPTTLR